MSPAPTATDIQRVNAFEVKVGGSALSPPLQAALTRVEVIQRINAPSCTILTFHDTATEGGSAMDTAALALGKGLKVSAKATEGGSSVDIFDGEVTALDFEVEGGGSYVTVRGHDKLQRLFHGTKLATKLDAKYSDIASQLAGAAGLGAQVESTSTTFAYLAQAWMSDGDMLARMAAEIGFVFYCRDAKLHFKKPGWSQASGATVRHGENLRRFRSSQTSEPGAAKVTVKGWDPKQKQVVVGTQGSVKANGAQLAADPATKYETYGGRAEVTVASLALPDQAAATTAATAIADRIGDAAVTAEGLCLGDPGIKPDTTVKVEGVPQPAAGEYYVTEARHIHDGEYHTEFHCSGALDASLWAAPPGVSTPSSQLPQHQPNPFVVLPGIVTNNSYGDAKVLPGTPAVKVKLPNLADDQESDWLRLVQPGAGTDQGMLFVPEVGDEVLVAFAHGDLRVGYVLGGLYNGKDKAGKELAPAAEVVKSGKVERRGIVSRIGQRIIIDDSSGKEQVLIEGKTSGDQILLDSGNKKILVQTESNKVEIDGQGKKVNVESQGDITLKATGNITIEATGNLNMKGTAGSKLEGTTVDIKADSAATMKGATTEVNGSGMTTVKGGMVMIN